MSELKTRYIDDTYVEYYNSGKHELAQIYLKSEADKAIADLEESHKKEVGQLLIEIVKLKADYKEACGRLQTANLIKDEQLAATRHHKHKRCLAMARWCEAENYTECWYHENSERCKWTEKWHRRWLELAEKFKEAK